MRRAMRIPELAQRDRFVRRAVLQRGVWAVDGEDGLGRVASPSGGSREVTLFWSNEAEAGRWSELIAKNPRVKKISTNAFIADVLPELEELGRTVGLDWSSAPLEVELGADDLVLRLRHAYVELFLLHARRDETVWMLEDTDGPALLVAQHHTGRLMLPCWASRSEAEQRIEGPWAKMLAVEIPLTNFVSATLPWLKDQGWLVAPGYVQGGSTMEIEPGELARRIEPEAFAISA